MKNNFRTEVFKSRKHIKLIKKWLDYWKKKGYKNHQSLDMFHFDRFEISFVTYYKNKFFGFSGIEDVSNWIPNTYRILSRGVTTNVCKERWFGRGPENNLFMIKNQAAIQCYYCSMKNPSYNVIMSCNIKNSGSDASDKSVKMGKYFNNPRNFSEMYSINDKKIQKIWNLDQYVYDVNVDYAIELGEKFYGKETFYKILDNI